MFEIARAVYLNSRRSFYWRHLHTLHIETIEMPMGTKKVLLETYMQMYFKRFFFEFHEIQEVENIEAHLKKI